MSAISLEHVERSFASRRGPVHAVRDLSLQIADGELMVLVGPSGCGKSTILKLIAGLERPDRGTIHMDEQCVNNLEPRDRDVAMVFQQGALYPHMSVERNLAFALKMRGVPGTDRRTRVQEAARLLGIEELLDRRPSTLSGGEQQRVALGRAIVRQPRLFLFDEPFAALDAGLRATMRTELKALLRRLRITTLFVTHDQEEAMLLGDRLAVLRDGTLQQCGTPLEIYHRPANRFVASFIGAPPMNFLSGRIRVRNGASAWESPIGTCPLDTVQAGSTLWSDGTPIELGIRPEDVHLAIGHEPATTKSHEDSRGELAPPNGAANRTNDWATLEQLEVIQVDSLGDRTFVHLRTTSGETVVARTASSALTPGQAVTIRLNLSRAHLFGADGQRLETGWSSCAETD